VYLLQVANDYSSCLREVSTILSLLEQDLHWLLGIPSLANLLKEKVLFNGGDVAVGEK
jgi:hypothetical protein